MFVCVFVSVRVCLCARACVCVHAQGENKRERERERLGYEMKLRILMFDDGSRNSITPQYLSESSKQFRSSDNK